MDFKSETMFYTRVQQLDLRFGVKFWCYGKTVTLCEQLSCTLCKCNVTVDECLVLLSCCSGVSPALCT